MLAVHADRLVTRDELIDGVWGERPPPSVVNRVHVLISSLRAVLEPGREKRAAGVVLRSAAGGYQLLLSREQTDAARFEDLVEHARLLAADRRLPQAAAALDTALAMWRGTPLVGLPGPWVSAQRARLEQLRLSALEHHTELRLELGESAGLIARLAALRAENPLRERIVALLMTALSRAGQRAQALEVYADTRRQLVDHLGVEPGRDLQLTHRAILRDEHIASMTLSTVPAQLPGDVFGFTGRSKSLNQLYALLSRANRPDATAVAIAVVSGTAGAGKTALAVHWAHGVASRFPDGQLYVNLRGFDPGGTPMPPAEALRLLLTALGVRAEQMPADATALSALYRSVLSGRKMLVVLDNARDAEQVRPLLPGAPGCVVVVTSRDTLSGLIAAEGAVALRLDLPTVEEGLDLLAGRLGWHRISAEPQSAREIIALCAHLPLALVTVSARAATRPGIALSVLAAELREAGCRLDAFAGSDPPTNVRSTFSWSYQALAGEPAELFRRAAFHPGPVLTVSAAASLVGRPIAQTRRLLAELTDVNLLAEPFAGQYAMHDLLRAYAAELSEILDSPEDRAAAMRRMLDHYVHTSQAAEGLLEPHRERLRLPPPEDGVSPVALGSLDQALSWLDTEHPALVALVQLAGDAGFARHAWQLAHNLNTYFNRQGHWPDQVATQQAALDAAGGAADRTGQAYAHSGLARALFRLNDHEAAEAHLRRALDLFAELGDPIGQARAHLGIAFTRTRGGAVRDSLPHLRRALDLFTTAGYAAWCAQTLNDLGWTHALLGEYAEAIAYCEQALSQTRLLGDLHGQANTHDSLGFAHHHLGNLAAAVDHYRQAERLFSQCGERYLEAETLVRRGETLLAMGEREAARGAWEHALMILDDLNHPDSAGVRVRLRAVAAADDLVGPAESSRRPVAVQRDASRRR